ncbi:ER metallopeptidase Erm1 [Schizosaccharomyces pombe]|uniref:Putative endoplasmic reticulum metallopeptidase 1 n=2 Tax=Schizosaccharomyces pombe TaxID=4896 RepID=ERMP1_SCHPO|nr:putative metallopeptidase 1 [Schizosaccharomyces pombe]O94702.1 RecName: Full=Putative endoplasmic reticulum metallopeptidase 1; AltName: Full=FXNA-like protease [Schizosaccharomyces pombe 972h-]AFB69419.1 endoplasmic reticulum metallopeptidase 1 [Schizosaccharomyces pombe]CAA22540.1 Endoplasmic Reticulum metallopeptidase 1 (predicted) [Schizosaccharomyces pombe]|eukprot:NP_001342785.1 putative metallopeptidase 1 [Schizosaccharomyces pombe]
MVLVCASSSKCKRNTFLQLAMVLFAVVMARIALYFHNHLDEPLVDPYDANGNPQFSEANALKHVIHLSDDIGYRILGTIEQERAREYIMNEVLALQKQLQDGPNADIHQMEVSLESGDGAHRFDFMNKYVIKKYQNLKNIVVRLSNGTEACKEEAVLINAHVDSTLPSPGATDDALAVAILLEAIRIFISRPVPLTHSIVFLFNDAEESLQDASHMFITQSPLRDTIKCVVNLEACGTTGSEILFQATSNEMIKAYSHVPHPFGTVLADDVFRTGLILSDTDFRQFVQYGNLTGLDMAVVKNSYLYHTKKDLAPYISPGTPQNFGENILAILTYLVSPEADLNNMKSSGTVYFSVFNSLFFMYSKLTSKILNTLVGGLGILLTLRGSEGSFTVALIAQVISIAGIFVIPNIWAYILGNVLDCGMSWFRNEYWPLFIYLPAIFASLFFTESLFKRSEHLALRATIFIFSLLTFIPLPSAYLFTIIDFFMVFALFLNDKILAKPGTVHPLTYFIGSIGAMTVGFESAINLLEIFVPLTGRIGTDKVADNVVATVCVCGFNIYFPLMSPWIQRFRSRCCFRLGLLFSIFVVGFSSFILAKQDTYYDSLHPRRIFVQRMENITSNEVSLHIASADSAPGFDKLSSDLSSLLTDEPVVKTEMDDWNSDWDTVYPFSQFLGSYRIPLNDTVDVTTLPSIKFSNKVVKDNVVNVTVTVEHPGLIWTVVSFDADVLSWSLPEVPSTVRRHHVREVSAYGLDSYSFNMSYLEAPIYFDFVGVDGVGHYPSKASEGRDRASIQLCEKLTNDYLPDWTDTLCIGVVSGNFKLE